MNDIRFENVIKTYTGVNQPAVNDVSLDIKGESFVVLLGPSGCGKTTLLKMVNRLLDPTSGRIFLDDVDIRQLEVTELRRQIGYVIQQVGLFPHMTIEENIAVVPDLLDWDKTRIDQRIDEMLELVHLPIEVRSRYPSQLSGGQQQRVGLARALAADPKVLLMDEPFGAIDAITRTSLQDEVLELQNRLKKTVLFVTHDVDEALKLADEIVVLRDGKLVQMASPCDLLNFPVNDFVRELLDADDRIRQLSLLRVETVMKHLQEGEIPAADAIRIGINDSLRTALSLLLQPNVSSLVVTRDDQPVGVVSLDQIQSAGCEGEDL